MRNSFHVINVAKYFLRVHQEDSDDDLVSSTEHYLPENDHNLTSIPWIMDRFIQSKVVTLHISLHALVGNAATERQRINGTIKN